MEQINRIRALRNKQKISGTKVAEKLGVSPQYFYDLEKGERRLNETLILQLSEIFEVTPDYLLGFTDIQEMDLKTLAKIVDEANSATRADTARLLDIQNQLYTLKKEKPEIKSIIELVFSYIANRLLEISGTRIVYQSEVNNLNPGSVREQVSVIAQKVRQLENEARTKNAEPLQLQLDLNKYRRELLDIQDEQLQNMLKTKEVLAAVNHADKNLQARATAPKNRRKKKVSQ
jgi:transcriptional regulator with XRE-family HTH domain